MAMRLGGSLWALTIVTITMSVLGDALTTVSDTAGDTNTWCEHPGKRLLAYCSGQYHYTSLNTALENCLKRTDCGGVTYEPYIRWYTLRRGRELLYSRNGEKTWIRCKEEKDDGLQKLSKGEVKIRFPQGYNSLGDTLYYAIDGDRSTSDRISNPYTSPSIIQLEIKVRLKEKFDIYEIRLYSTDLKARYRVFKMNEIFGTVRVGKKTCYASQLSTWFMQYKCNESPSGDTVTFKYEQAAWGDVTRFSFELQEIEVYGRPSKDTKSELSATGVALIIVGILVVGLILYLWIRRCKRKQRARDMVRDIHQARINNRARDIARGVLPDPSSTQQARDIHQARDNQPTRRERRTEPADNVPNLRVVFTNTEREDPADRIPREQVPSVRIEHTHEHQTGIPLGSEISKLSPPSYQDSTSIDGEDRVPSYEEVMAQSDSFVLTNPVQLEMTGAEE